MIVLLVAVSATGATRVWHVNGTPGTSPASWTVAGNWGGVAPVPGDDLVFPDGSGNDYPNNDFPPGTQFNSILIDGFYTVTGNPVSVGPGTMTIGIPGQTTLISWRIPFTSGSARIVSGGSFFSLEGVTLGGPLTAIAGYVELGYDAHVGALAFNSNSSLRMWSLDQPPLTAAALHASADSLSFDSTSAWGVELSPAASTQMTVTGGVALGGAQLMPIFFKVFPAGTQLRIIDNVGNSPVSGTFAGLPEGATVKSWFVESPGVYAQKFSISYQGGTGNDVVLTALPFATSAVSLTSSPNPSIAGQSVTFTARVTSSAGTPTGDVRFFGNEKGSVFAFAFGLVTLDAAGVATITTPFFGGEAGSRLGLNPVYAEFDGNDTTIGSDSPVIDQNVVTAVPALDGRALILLALALMIGGAISARR
jgi:trimeric autotransporter adhesin